MQCVGPLRTHASKFMSKAKVVIATALEAMFGQRLDDRVARDTVREEPFAVFTEWASEADDEAYRSL